MPVISVIIPVYNAEKTLRRCINSFLDQTITLPFELILVDDGSEDTSAAICKEYEERHSFIHTISQPNQGVSFARQKGLDASLGEYVIHADSDDWVEPSMLEEMYIAIKQSDADMLICDFFMNDNNGENLVRQKPESLNHRVVLNQLLGMSLHGGCWNKLIRRSLISKYDVKFPTHVNRWEDLYVNAKLLMENINVSYLDKAYYHYCFNVNPKSLAKSVSLSSVNSQLWVTDYFCEKLCGVSYYNNSLKKMQIATKTFVFTSGCMSAKDFISLYSSVNEEMKKNARGVTERFLVAELVLHSKIPYYLWRFLGRMRNFFLSH